MQQQKNSFCASVLMLYDSTQTFTSTVFEHVSSFSKYSEHSWFYIDYRNLISDKVNLSCFDIVAIHYSVRLPFSQISDLMIQKLRAFKGLKLLFIQDEYDYVNKTRSTMLDIKFNLIFTVVPDKSISLIYPPDEFDGVLLINNLTGYVPDNLSSQFNVHIPPSKRSLVIAYRGRQLPIQYGSLGIEKNQIGVRVKAYCKLNNISHDIALEEKDRIYGDAWYQFICSSKAMLGSESGSNVFDWDGNLKNKIDKYRKQNPNSSKQKFDIEDQIYDKIVAPMELDGVMNQISPRVFEMIAARTVMILFEGDYSGVVTPHKHYIPLKKDFSNLDEVFSLLNDGDYIDEMVDNVYEDVISSKKYSYQTFMKMVDQKINISIKNFSGSLATKNLDTYRKSIENVCLHPVKTENVNNYNLPLTVSTKAGSYFSKPINFIIKKIVYIILTIGIKILLYLPMPIRTIIIKFIKKILRRI